MINPKNCRKKHPLAPPAEIITKVRKAATLTQKKTADLVHTVCRVVQHWEAGEHAMPPSAWELLLIKTQYSKTSQEYLKKFTEKQKFIHK